MISGATFNERGRERASLLGVRELPVKLKHLWPCKSHPGHPLAKAWQLIGCRGQWVKSTWPLRAPRFSRTSFSTLLANNRPQCCPGHVTPMGLSSCDLEIVKSHHVWTQKTHTAFSGGSGLEWHPKAASFHSGGGITLQVLFANQAKDGEAYKG